MDQLVQILGSLLILTAFVAAQRGRLSTESRLKAPERPRPALGAR